MELHGNDSTRMVHVAAMPFAIWVFLRVLVPTGPIGIQYSLYALGVYDPPFPQPTYIVLLFALAMVTTTEYRRLDALLYGSVLPALAGCVLYTVYLFTADDPAQHLTTLLVGFYLWAFLLTVNVARVLLDIVKRVLEPGTK